VDGGDLGSGRDLCELGLDALPFGRDLIDLRVVDVEIRALRNVRDQAIDLAVELAVCGAADASHCCFRLRQTGILNAVPQR